MVYLKIKINDDILPNKNSNIKKKESFSFWLSQTLFGLFILLSTLYSINNLNQNIIFIFI